MKTTINLTTQEALNILNEHFATMLEYVFDEDSINVVVKGLNDTPEYERQLIADTCIELLDGNEKIKAIKFFRMHTGIGLKKSKEIMDEYETKLRPWVETGKL